jgi:hypothetical protein
LGIRILVEEGSLKRRLSEKEHEELKEIRRVRTSD